MYRFKIYIETTLFNYFFDENRPGHDDVVELFQAIKAGDFVAYTSRYVTDELKRAPEPKRSDMLNLIEEYGIITLNPDVKAEALARKYINSGIIPASHFYDSLHIAISAINGLYAILSYNFHHINRDKTRTLTAGINEVEGYDVVKISTAREVMDDAKKFFRGGRTPADGSC
ncbi:MAG: hypothetical protein IJS99_03775 [Synergistaceae bacterium]|nr:hypothetical protein [Synergistaceae bacterium]